MFFFFLFCFFSILFSETIPEWIDNDAPEDSRGAVAGGGDEPEDDDIEDEAGEANNRGDGEVDDESPKSMDPQEQERRNIAASTLYMSAPSPFVSRAAVEAHFASALGFVSLSMTHPLPRRSFGRMAWARYENPEAARAALTALRGVRVSLGGDAEFCDHRLFDRGVEGGRGVHYYDCKRIAQKKKKKKKKRSHKTKHTRRPTRARATGPRMARPPPSASFTSS
jgi:hypothetical protein